MRHIFLTFILVFFIYQPGFCQQKINGGDRIFFQGLVMDESSLSPIANSQIMINRSFAAVSNGKGNFAFYVSKYDTVVFKKLGYKPTTMFVSDTLKGQEFISGIFMSSDTLVIGEVVIVPRFTNFKYEILNARSKTPETFDNAKYNVAVSAYQGRISEGKLGSPTDNYAYLMQKRKSDVYDKGAVVPSDQIIGFNSLLLPPGAYLLLHGMADQTAPPMPLTDQELNQIRKKFLENTQKRK
jgi:hypothetical protein